MEYTPLFRQYLEIKEGHPDKLVIFQLGDFYELYREDAEIASKVLNIALTRRVYKDVPIPMAGFPVHTIDNHIPKLIKAGYKVVVCDQLEDAQAGKGLVKRGITRVISAGTAVEELLSDYDTPKLMGVLEKNGEIQYSVLNKLRGQIIESVIGEEDLNSIILSFEPSEVVVQSNQIIEILSSIPVQKINGQFNSSTELVLSYLKILEPLNTQKFTSSNSSGNTFVLDGFAISGLEIFQTQQGEGIEGTLLWAIDETVTSMGKRALKERIKTPLKQIDDLNSRLNEVQWFIENRSKCNEVRLFLKSLSDLDRLSAKIIRLRVTPKEVLALRESLKQSIAISAMVDGKLLSFADIKKLNDLFLSLDKFISDDPPNDPRDRSFIKCGYNTDLDGLAKAESEYKAQILQIEEQERSETGISNLRTGYNDIFGYYLELSRGNKDKVPSRFSRLQTLKNVERYTTTALQEVQSKLRQLIEDRKELELKLYHDLMRLLLDNLQFLQSVSAWVARIDIVSSFAYLSVTRNYSRPNFVSDGSLMLKESRHPVLDKIYSDKFIPNDIEIASNGNFLLITGPNMAGKSTYIRQVAHIVLLAQIGCYVPCTEAIITPVDGIFARIGASDRLYKGESTFMVEMKEVSHIIKNATPKSLVILDEVGRGTSTFDGLAIAWAISEYLHDKTGAVTMFTTHYSELVKLSEKLARLVVMRAKISEWKGEVVYLYKFERGAAEKSYGIHVAKLAELPKEIIEKATSVQARLDKVSKESGFSISKAAVLSKEEELFALVSKKELQDIKLFMGLLSELDYNNLTPMQAISKLSEISKKARELI